LGRKIFIPSGSDGKSEISKVIGKARLKTKAKATAQKIAGGDKVVKVDLSSKIQKAILEASSPSERRKLAYRYIMENFAGDHKTSDGRVITINSITAGKMTYDDHPIKIKVSPQLADLLQKSEFSHMGELSKERKDNFVKFAYYNTDFDINGTMYKGQLNIGITNSNKAVLYDIKPITKT